MSFRQLLRHMRKADEQRSESSDADRASAIAAKLVQAIDSEQLLDLRELLDKNQNDCAGDGSFDSLTWTHLRDLRNALETAVFKYNVLRFSRPEQSR